MGFQYTINKNKNGIGKLASRDNNCIRENNHCIDVVEYKISNFHNLPTHFFII